MTIQRLNQLFTYDNSINDLIKYLKTNELPEYVKNENKYKNKYKGFIIKNNDLIYEPLNLIVIDKSKIDDVLNEEYKNNYGGIINFYKYLSTKYINITREDVKSFLQSDNFYQLKRKPLPISNKPIISKHINHIWAIDLIDMSTYKKSNYNYSYIVSVIDIFSRYSFLEKSIKKDASEIAECLYKILKNSDVDPPKYILSDQGNEFKGEFSEYCKKLDIKNLYTRAYSAQSNGIIERRNMEIRKIINALSLNENNIKWTPYLSKVQDIVNNSYNRSIKNIPSKIWSNYAIEDIDDDVLKENQKKAEKQVRKDAMDKIEKFKTLDNFKEGDVVRIKMSSIFNNMKKEEKNKNTKGFIVHYSPILFIIEKVYIPRSGKLERKRYIVKNKETGNIVKTSKGVNKMFFFHELMHIPPSTNETIKMNMIRALKLNKVETNNNDLIYE